jgi:hypothetical protein
MRNDARLNSWSQRSRFFRQGDRRVVALDREHQGAVRQDLGLRGLVWYLAYAEQSLTGVVIGAACDLQARLL